MFPFNSIILQLVCLITIIAGSNKDGVAKVQGAWSADDPNNEISDGRSSRTLSPLLSALQPHPPLEQSMSAARIPGVSSRPPLLRSGTEPQLDDHDLNEKIQDKMINVEVVGDWLKNTVGLPTYHQLFINHGLDDMDLIKDVKERHLEKMGIDKIGHQIKILQEIRKLSSLLP